MTKLTPEQRKEIKLRDELKRDFLAYSLAFLKIRPKAGGIEPFRMNAAQLYIHKRLEDQLKRIGKVRACIVKGRQQGCSTYIEGRFIWKTTMEKGQQAFILTHKADATANLFTMAKRFYDNLPPFIKPELKTNNANELYFGTMDSGYKVSTAGSEGVGRGSTLKYVHGSEVAFWQFAEDHMGGLMEAVPDGWGSEIILESTSDGPGNNYFYKKCIQARDDPEDDFELIFIPWYWQPEYRAQLPEEFQLTDEERDFKNLYRLDDEQMFWRRKKIKLLGINRFVREYPATVDEAFSKSAENALWNRDMFRYLQPGDTEPRWIRTVVGIDPAINVKRTSDRTGIVVASLGDDGKAYVRADASAKYTPIEWGEKAVDLYNRFKADLIVAETNQGGQMVEHTIRSIDPLVAYKGIHVQDGPRLRAEPLAHCYRRGEVVHVPGLNNLELAMTTWNPYAGEHTPDEVSALTRALTELLQLSKRAGRYRMLL